MKITWEDFGSHADADWTPESAPEDTRCAACRAGSLGGRFTLAIEEGTPFLKCAACGQAPRWIEDLDTVFIEMNPVPVSVTQEFECENPGGWHGLERCDHGWAIVITPATPERAA
jgi:hypothetical protein